MVTSSQDRQLDIITYLVFFLCLGDLKSSHLACGIVYRLVHCSKRSSWEEMRIWHSTSGATLIHSNSPYNQAQRQESVCVTTAPRRTRKPIINQPNGKNEKMWNHQKTTEPKNQAQHSNELSAHSQYHHFSGRINNSGVSLNGSI